jgi:hypothetical protein
MDHGQSHLNRVAHAPRLFLDDGVEPARDQAFELRLDDFPAAWRQHDHDACAARRHEIEQPLEDGSACDRIQNLWFVESKTGRTARGRDDRGPLQRIHRGRRELFQVRPVERHGARVAANAAGARGFS